MRDTLPSDEFLSDVESIEGVAEVSSEDTLAPFPADSLSPADTVEASDTISSAGPDEAAAFSSDTGFYRRGDSLIVGHSSLDAPAFSGAKDSIVEVFTDGQKKIYYYGDVSVTYQDMNIKSEYMEYDMNTGTVYAHGIYDTLKREWKGQPVMTQAGKTYKMEDVRYNFNTRKARINNMLTAEDDGLLHGKRIKMVENNSINVTGGKYTVCDLEHPHYYLALSSARVTTKPTKKTVFGPAYLVLEDIPMPVALPFGFIPKRPERATGLLMPSFGEEQTRGFFFKDAGMYFVIGDYFDFSVTGDYYTLGSWAIDFNSRYKVNYKFNGNIAVNYSKDIVGEKGSADYEEMSNFGVRWSHSQDSKAHPGTSFSASVNFSSPQNSRYNSRSVKEALNNQASSSISYGRSFNGRFNLSLNALHSQNTRDSSYSFTLPNVTFSMSTIYPFKRKNRVGKERFYEQISFGYSTSLQNRINFKASQFDLKNKDFWNKFQNGMTHNFNIGLPSFSLFKYINFSPSVSYGQNWFFRKTEYVYDPVTDKPKAIDSGLFSTLGITQTFSASASMNTRLYGMFNFGKDKHIQAIRHVISPSASISWSPNMATSWNGYRTLTYVDALGKEQTYEYNLYQGQLNSPPGKGQSASASFSIGNNFEAKVTDKADTTGTGTKKVKLIDQLNLSSGYNFMADSLRWSNLAMNMSTTLFGKVNISASASFDPYAIGSNGSRINKAAIAMGQGLMRLQNANASISYSISGKGSMNGNDGTRGEEGSSSGGSHGGGGEGESAASYYQRIYYHPYTNEYIPGGWLYYTNPNVPWSVNFGYNFSLSNTYSLDENGRLKCKSHINQTLSVNGNIRLTPRMNIQMSTGFDFSQMKMTTTQLSASYDLHCFNIAVSFIPMGTYKSYSFRIAANASALADLLKIKKSSSYWDN